MTGFIIAIKRVVKRSTNLPVYQTKGGFETEGNDIGKEQGVCQTNFLEKYISCR